MSTVHTPITGLGLGLLLLAAGIAPAAAGSFSVSPVRVALDLRHPVAAIRVHNGSGEATVMQLESMAWSQESGKDVYTQTRELLATPPVFTVPAGGSQLVRIGLRGSPDARVERSFRVYFTEVPPPPKPGFQGLQVALRLGVPVFVAPASGASAPVVTASLSVPAGNSARLALMNSGNAHVQFSGFDLLEATGGKPLASRKLSGYLLPGQRHEWSLDLGNRITSADGLRLVAGTDAGEMSLVVSPPGE